MDIPCHVLCAISMLSVALVDSVAEANIFCLMLVWWLLWWHCLRLLHCLSLLLAELRLHWCSASAWWWRYIMDSYP